MAEPDWAEPGRWCPKCGADASDVIELNRWGSAKPVAELRRYACCETAHTPPTTEDEHDHWPAPKPARRRWWTPARKTVAGSLGTYAASMVAAVAFATSGKPILAGALCLVAVVFGVLAAAFLAFA